MAVSVHAMGENGTMTGVAPQGVRTVKRRWATLAGVGIVARRTRRHCELNPRRIGFVPDPGALVGVRSRLSSALVPEPWRSFPAVDPHCDGRSWGKSHVVRSLSDGVMR